MIAYPLENVLHVFDEDLAVDLRDLAGLGESVEDIEAQIEVEAIGLGPMAGGLHYISQASAKRAKNQTTATSTGPALMRAPGPR